MSLLFGGETVPQCSKAGCRAAATHELRWRNPRIHAEDRRKIWLACDEHVADLEGFLSSRGFPVERAAFTAAGDGAER